MSWWGPDLRRDLHHSDGTGEFLSREERDEIERQAEADGEPVDFTKSPDVWDGVKEEWVPFELNTEESK